MTPEMTRIVEVMQHLTYKGLELKMIVIRDRFFKKISKEVQELWDTKSMPYGKLYNMDLGVDRSIIKGLWGKDFNIIAINPATFEVRVGKD